MHEMPGGYLEISRWQYLLTQLRVMGTYVRLALFPFNQNLDYAYPVVSDLFMHDAWQALSSLSPWQPAQLHAIAATG